MCVRVCVCVCAFVRLFTPSTTSNMRYKFNYEE